MTRSPLPDSEQDIAQAAETAAARIGGLIRETPLEYSPLFSREAGVEVWFKLENLQHTGSFKLRGAANSLLCLSESRRKRGCVTASSGNHGAAVAYAMRALDVPGIIFVPQGTSPAKVDAIRAYGGQVEFYGDDGLDTELHARTYARDRQMHYVSPYNDADVIAGQASCGVEIRRQLPDADAVFIAVGGGGLISGVGSVLKAEQPDLQLYGCQPAASAVMARSVAAGKVVELASEATLSDGTAGGVEADAITFEYCRTLVDDWVLVDEEEIATGMRLFIDRQRQLAEGAAGVAIAALRRRQQQLQGKKAVVLICGGNVARQTLRTIL